MESEMLSISCSALLFIDKRKNRAWDRQPSPGTNVAMKDKADKDEAYNKYKKQNVKSIKLTSKLWISESKFGWGLILT